MNTSKGRPLKDTEKVGYIKNMKSLLNGQTKPKNIVITLQELEFHEKTR